MIGNVLSSLVGDLIHSSNSPRRQVHFKRELNLNPESPTFVKLYNMENKTRKSPCDTKEGYRGRSPCEDQFILSASLVVVLHSMSTAMFAYLIIWPIVNVNTITDDLFLFMLSHHHYHQVYTVAQS